MGRVTQLPSSKDRHNQELKFTFDDSTLFRIKVCKWLHMHMCMNIFVCMHAYA